MKSNKIIVSIFFIFIIMSSKSVFAIDGIFVEENFVEVYELDLNKDGSLERVEIIRDVHTPSYVSYFVYDSVTGDLIFSRENLYRGIIDVKSNSIIESLPIYNEDFFILDDTYEEREYSFEYGNMVCISNVTKETSYLMNVDELSSSSMTYYENPSRAQVESMLEEVALNKGIPPTILKAIAYSETGFKQFKNGKPILSFDGVSWGIMQVTPRYYPNLDIERLKYDIKYNIEAGADILLGKWEYGFSKKPSIPKIGDGDIRSLEDWYFAIWAYNGLVESNNPNMIPYKHSSWIQNEAYQEKVLRHAKEILGQDIASIPKELLPSKGLADPKIYYYGLKNSKKDKYRLFNKNQIVKVVANSGLVLRNDKMEKIGTIANGGNLRIEDVPLIYDGYYRYKVREVFRNGSTGKVGWVAANWLISNDNLNKASLVWQRRKDVVEDKTWDIKFNFPIDADSVSLDSVYIEDAYGNKIASRVYFDNKNYNVLKIAPVNLYKSGREYTLFIKGIKSSGTNGLKEYIQMSFVIR